MTMTTAENKPDGLQGAKLAGRYSPSERKVFGLLVKMTRRSGRVTITDVAKKYYAGEEQIPINGPTVVRGVIATLAEKMRRNGEEVAIARTRRAGPDPVRYWLEPATR